MTQSILSPRFPTEMQFTPIPNQEIVPAIQLAGGKRTLSSEDGKSVSPELERMRKKGRRVEANSKSDLLVQRAAAPFLNPIEKIVLAIRGEPSILRHQIRFWAHEKRGDILIAIWRRFQPEIRSDFQLLKQLGKAFYSLNLLQDANEFLNLALEKRPNSLECRYLRGIVSARIEKFDLADQDMQSLSSIASTASRYLAIYIFWLKKEYRTAVYCLELAKLEIHSSFHHFTLLNRIIGELASLDTAEAKELLARLEPLRPKGMNPCLPFDSLPLPVSPDKFFQSSCCNKICEAALEIPKKNGEILIAVEFWARTKNTEMVAALYEKFYEIIDADFEILSILAHYYADEKLDAQAFSFIQKASYLRQNCPSLLYLEAHLLIRGKQFAKAREKVEALSSIDNSFPTHYLAALLCAESGKYHILPDCVIKVADQMLYSVSLTDVVRGALAAITNSFIGMPEEAIQLLPVKERLQQLCLR